MALTDLKKRFLSSLEEGLKPRGFVLVCDAFYGLSFIREIGGIRHFFDLSMRKSGEGVEIANLFVGIRFDAVERMVATYEDHLPFDTEKDLARRRTLGTWLTRNFENSSERRWLVEDKPTFLKALKDVQELLETTGFPFLEKYSSAEQAMSLLEADEEEARWLVGPDAKRAKEAITVALLTRGLTAAMEMKDKKLAFLEFLASKEPYNEVSKWASRLFAAEGPNERIC